MFWKFRTHEPRTAIPTPPPAISNEKAEVILTEVKKLHDHMESTIDAMDRAIGDIEFEKNIALLMLVATNQRNELRILNQKTMPRLKHKIDRHYEYLMHPRIKPIYEKVIAEERAASFAAWQKLQKAAAAEPIDRVIAPAAKNGDGSPFVEPGEHPDANKVTKIETRHVKRGAAHKATLAGRDPDKGGPPEAA